MITSFKLSCSTHPTIPSLKLSTHVLLILWFHLSNYQHIFYSSYDSIFQTLYTFSTHPMIPSLKLSTHFLLILWLQLSNYLHIFYSSYDSISQTIYTYSTHSDSISQAILFYSSYDFIFQTIYTYAIHPMIPSFKLSTHILFILWLHLLTYLHIFFNHPPPWIFTRDLVMTIWERKRENVRPNFGFYKKSLF